MCMRVCLWEFMCAMDVQKPEDIKRSHWFPQDWHHRQLGAATRGQGDRTHVHCKNSKLS